MISSAAETSAPLVESGLVFSRASRPPLLRKAGQSAEIPSYLMGRQPLFFGAHLPSTLVIFLHTSAALAFLAVPSPSRKILFRCVFSGADWSPRCFQGSSWGILQTGWSIVTSELDPVSLRPLSGLPFRFPCRR